MINEYILTWKSFRKSSKCDAWKCKTHPKKKTLKIRCGREKNSSKYRNNEQWALWLFLLENWNEIVSSNSNKTITKKFFRCYTIFMSFCKSGRRIGMPVEMRFCLRLPKLQPLVFFSFWFYSPRSINSMLFVFPRTELILPWEFSRGKEQVIEGNNEKKIDNFQWFYFWCLFLRFFLTFNWMTKSLFFQWLCN